MEPLVSLATAKKHLKLDGSADDVDLQMKLEQATAIVLDYVDQRRSDGDEWSATIATWTEETVPRMVQAAILCEFAALYRFRGDDTDRPTFHWRMWIDRLRDPAIA